MGRRKRKVPGKAGGRPLQRSAQLDADDDVDARGGAPGPRTLEDAVRQTRVLDSRRGMPYLVIHKPSDVRLSDGPISVLQICRQLRPDVPYFFFPHRLDYATNGVQVVALSKLAAADATALFESRNTRKLYVALVYGSFPLAESTGATDFCRKCSATPSFRVQPCTLVRDEFECQVARRFVDRWGTSRPRSADWCDALAERPGFQLDCCIESPQYDESFAVRLGSCICPLDEEAAVDGATCSRGHLVARGRWSKQRQAATLGSDVDREADAPSGGHRTLDACPCKGRASRTLVWPIAHAVYRSSIPCTIVLLRPVSGRRHQLRLHMSTCGYPILGDFHYAASRRDDHVTSAPRMMLTSTRLDLHFECLPARRARQLVCWEWGADHELAMCVDAGAGLGCDEADLVVSAV